MNYHQDELTAKYNRERVREVFDQIHLEKAANRSNVNSPSLFTRTMHNFSIWMISTGKEMHERYELPAAHCHQSTSSSFAR